MIIGYLDPWGNKELTIGRVGMHLVSFLRARKTPGSTLRLLILGLPRPPTSFEFTLPTIKDHGALLKGTWGSWSVTCIRSWEKF